MQKDSMYKGRKRDMLELDFGHTPDILKEEYLDVYESIQSKYEVLYDLMKIQI